MPIAMNRRALQPLGELETAVMDVAWKRPSVTAREVCDRIAARILADHGDAALSAFVDAAAKVDDTLLDELRRLITLRRRETR